MRLSGRSNSTRIASRPSVSRRFASHIGGRSICHRDCTAPSRGLNQKMGASTHVTLGTPARAAAQRLPRLM